MRTGWTVASVVGLCCAAACSSQSTNSEVKSQQVQALNGATVSVSAADVPAGLKALVGARVSIPPRALAHDTLVTVGEGPALSGLPQGFKVLGVPVAFGPVGTPLSSPATISFSCPYDPAQLAGGQISVAGVDATGKVSVVGAADLKVSANGTVTFTASALKSFVCGWGPIPCPPGEELCGCCGSGRCQPAGEVCNMLCPANACPPPGGGCATGCPAGEYFCGCGDVGRCIPDTEACPLACPVQQGAPANASGQPLPVPNVLPPPSVCCGPDTYFCGCGDQGQCIPDEVPCPIACPVCDPTTAPTLCGCLPAGVPCKCDPTINQASAGVCQCGGSIPPPGTTAGGPAIIVCEVDGGNGCLPPNVMTPCGCIPDTAMCDPLCPQGETRCCDGQCVPAGSVCPTVCAADGGGMGACGPGYNDCCGHCIPQGQACTMLCPVDGGSPPKCAADQKVCCTTPNDCFCFSATQPCPG